MVTLKKPQLNDKFTLELKLGSQKIQVSGSFVKSCQESYTSPCTIIIAFLASLCLILFTALALALIILRRKKPITFKFGQREDRESIQYDSGKSYNETNYEETFEQSNKIESTIDVTANNILIGAKAVSKDSPSLTSMPRKSSLKPPKTNFSDQLNNNGIYENAAYTGGELDVVHEVSEDKPIDEKPVFQEGRRKSIVTFSETTQVKFG
ncbi:unnamed protein product [Oppiella nova]|uniref:Uncharacterized protein n=1 Tax=Oppiella nova TaxID=334625 RepID=A0A7R9MCX9_9ACAR|nr:unnamed protein product [Oppiella nova]CAG2174885.1 unnamed protein product [Oppiella nova]